MVRKKYHMSFQKAEKSEPIIRKFLLSNSDTVRFTHRPYKSFTLGKLVKIQGLFGKVHCDENDPRFKKVINILKPYIIKKVRDNKLYDNVPQGKKLFTHYFFKLSPKVKRMIKEDHLFPKAIELGFKNFACFEDPTFYKNGKMIGSVISHEPIFSLYLTDNEKKIIEKKGVEFD